MVLPKKVTIGGVTFKVKRTKIEAYGEMDFEVREITISTSIKDNLVAIETLRHEMIHATLALAGHSWAENYDEEALIRCLENMFFPAWDNLTKKHGI